jgi:hypothetical protein
VITLRSRQPYRQPALSERETRLARPVPDSQAAQPHPGACRREVGGYQPRPGLESDDLSQTSAAAAACRSCPPLGGGADGR